MPPSLRLHALALALALRGVQALRRWTLCGDNCFDGWWIRRLTWTGLSLGMLFSTFGIVVYMPMQHQHGFLRGETNVFQDTGILLETWLCARHSVGSHVCYHGLVLDTFAEDALASNGPTHCGDPLVQNFGWIGKRWQRM